MKGPPVNVTSAARRWFAEWQQKWRERSVSADLKSQESPVKKATVTLESPTRVASVTAWETGTVEFIVLELETQKELVIEDKEFQTAEELREVLEKCASTFDRLMQSA